MIVLDDLSLLMPVIFSNDAFVTKQQPLGELIEFLALVRS